MRLRIGQFLKYLGPMLEPLVDFCAELIACPPPRSVVFLGEEAPAPPLGLEDCGEPPGFFLELIFVFQNSMFRVYRVH